MIYVDTSVLVALCVPEPKSGAVLDDVLARSAKRLKIKPLTF